MPSFSFSSKLPRATVFKIIGYTLYGCLICGLFLGVRIAEQNAEPTITAALKKVQPVKIAATGIKVSFIPPSLSASTFTIKDKRSRKVLYTIEKFKAVPSFSNILSGSIGVDVTGKAYGGKLAVHAQSGSMFDFNTAKLNAELKNQSLGAIPAVRSFDKKAKGKGSVFVSYSGSTKDLKKGSGSLKVSGKDIQLRNPVPVLKMKSFENVNLDGAIKFKGLNCNIEQFALTSKKIRTTLKGSATLNLRNINKTKLALSSKLFIPHTELVTALFDKRAIARLKNNKDLYLSIKGEVRNPKLDMDYNKR